MACTMSEEQQQTTLTEQQQIKQEVPTSNSLCDECQLKSFKYKCPACSRRTCSLPCVKSHKINSACSGKKLLSTHNIPLSQFDDSTILSDYNLLEDVKRVAESAQRMRQNLCGTRRFGLPKHLEILQHAARNRRMNLLFLPAGMSKRVKNNTRYQPKQKFIAWTIEWRFHLTDVAFLEHGVREKKTLRSVIENHLQPSPWRNKLRRFSESTLDNLKLFIRKDPKDSKSPFRELDLDTPLRQLFRGLIILEYPVIQVFLRSDSYDFKVVKIVSRPPARQKSKEPSRDNTSSPLGTVFKEEEIQEDEDAPEPRIIDILKHSEADRQKTTSSGVKINNDPSNNLATRESTKSSPSLSSRRHAAESDNVFSSSCGTEVEMLETNVEDFNFDQDLINAYSFLLEQSNPDDYLDYKQEGGGADHDSTDVYFANMEELEEGEIPSSD